MLLNKACDDITTNNQNAVANLISFLILASDIYHALDTLAFQLQFILWMHGEGIVRHLPIME